AILPARKIRDGALGWEIDFGRMPLTFTADRSRFWVEILRGDAGATIEDDDRGTSVEVRELDDGARWRVRWTPDLALADAKCDPRCGQTFRIAVRGRVHFESRPFQLVCPCPVSP